jgi:hypothetical protein
MQVAGGARPTKNRVLGKAEFMNGFKSVCAITYVFRKFFLTNTQINFMMGPFHPKRGAGRDRHERGMECDGR